MSIKKSDDVTILDKSSRRRFIRAGSGVLVASAAGVFSAKTLASDCDQSQEARTDQDAGESADPKGCQPKNIISQNQPKRSAPVVVKTIKA